MPRLQGLAGEYERRKTATSRCKEDGDALRRSQANPANGKQIYYGGEFTVDVFAPTAPGPRRELDRGVCSPDRLYPAARAQWPPPGSAFRPAAYRICSNR